MMVLYVELTTTHYPIYIVKKKKRWITELKAGKFDPSPYQQRYTTLLSRTRVEAIYNVVGIDLIFG